jgi:hypothetical protein
MKLPTRFYLQFEVKVYTVGDAGEVLNFLDIVDVGSLTSLLNIGVASDMTLSVSFWEAPYIALTAPLGPLTSFTTVIVGYIDNTLSLWTSALIGSTPSVTSLSAETDLSPSTFYLFASTPFSVLPSASGLVRNFYIRRKSCFHPSGLYYFMSLVSWGSYFSPCSCVRQS